MAWLHKPTANTLAKQLLFEGKWSVSKVAQDFAAASESSLPEKAVLYTGKTYMTQKENWNSLKTPYLLYVDILVNNVKSINKNFT